MSTLTSSTFKSVYASIGLHVVFVVLGSWAFYNNSVHTLELTGKAGGGGRTISLSSINFSSKKSMSAPVRSIPTKAIEKSVVTKTATKSVVATTTTTDTVSVTNGAVSAAVTGGSGSGSGNGSGSGSGNGVGDFDKGRLLAQVQSFYDARLRGTTINIREDQSVKIKLTLNNEGDILDAILVQGQLDMSVLRRIISVAKSIPLKNFWNSSKDYPKELIIPLFLTAG